MMKDLLNNKKALGLLAGGIAGLTVGLVLRKKAKLKCGEIMKEFVQNQEIIEQAAESSENYTEEDKQQDITINKTQTAIGIIKAYTPCYAAMVVGGCMAINGAFKIYKEVNINEVVEDTIVIE